MHRRTVSFSRARSAAAAVALAAVASAVSAGCGGETSSTHTPVVMGGTVTVATAAETPDFHPYAQFGSALAPYAYDSLVSTAPGGRVVSGLAQTWHDGAVSASFTLRKGVTCSDGTPLTASGVARSLRYAGDPRNRLVGARAALPDVPFTVSADDAARTVSVRTASPYGFILRTVGLLPVVCPAGLTDPGTLERSTRGTGPYVLSGYTSGGPYVFTRRKGYAWGPGGATNAAPGQPERIVVSVVPQESTVANLLLTGGVNIAAVTGPDRARLTGHGLATARVPTVVGLTFFNERPGRPLSDPVLRRALVGALDRKGLANVAIGGEGTPASHLTAADSVCHADVATANLPSRSAVRALGAAGWTKNARGRLAKRGRPLKLRLLSSPDFGSTLPSVAELMAATWQALGADVDLVSESRNAVVQAMYQSGDFDVVVGSSPGPPLPAQLTPYFSGPPPSRGLNFAHVTNHAYDRFAALALRAPGTAGCADWNRAAAALFRSADALPVADGTGTVYGYRTTFAVAPGGRVVPTSIRLHR
ncbi:ABC transporter substrate-binding protein [Streptomyces sp. SID4985]|uniref:ABC transporter substrate-binding protein n=1 Tax=unclassified Streptomyces TaxID=2593676 RepID=UPI0013683D1F|nr:ABC transporter substrate-binding protein [Streptomyces sp. SID4985]MYQ43831.1 ABC transporter substrate-binding protein [Streptomyces sp. SID4985]